MTDRTFRQHAIAFGSTPAQVVCQINGNTVFNGTVTTLDEPFPSLPDPEYSIENVAWTWQNDATFAGTQTFSVTVTGSPLLLGSTFANDPLGNVEDYMPFYQTQIGNVVYVDPFTDEAIDGAAQNLPSDTPLAGQWWWTIPAGSTFSATMHVDAPPAPDPETPEQTQNPA